VRPNVEYATPVWSPWFLPDIQKIEKVQERAVKIISGLNGGTYDEKCKEVGLETVENCRNVQDMAQAFKQVQKIDKQSRTDVRKYFFT
jgi:ribonucleases P/MRP protein subunit RPP40